MQPIFSQNSVAGFNERKGSELVRFFESYYPVILTQVMLQTESSPDAEDLVSDIIVKILSHPGKFKTLRNIENFVEKVINTTCLDNQRKKETRERLDENLALHLQNLDDYNEAAAITDIAFQSIVYLAIEKLPQRSKCIFLLYYLRGLKNREIARLMRIQEKTVENHKNFVLRKLRLEMERQGIHNREALLKWMALFWYLSQF